MDECVPERKVIGIGADSRRNEKSRRVLAIFLSSLFLTLLVLFAGSGIKDHAMREKMAGYARASSRETDGAANLAVMSGDSGYVDRSNVYLQYLQDGFIRIKGTNEGESSRWKKIGELTLEPGTYTLTGLSGCEESTAELQLTVINAEGKKTYYRQFDADVTFELSVGSEAALHVRVYPHTEIDVVARPAIYKEAD